MTALVPTFASTGASVKVGGVTQVSGTTSHDFTGPVQYVVTAQDGSTEAYTVTVTVALSSAKALTAFWFVSHGRAGTINETARTVAISVPVGTGVTALVATFAATGAGVKVGGIAQVSGTTANDFTNPLQYVVTAQDGIAATYTVSVTFSLPAPRLSHLDQGAWISDPDPPVGTISITGWNTALYALTADGAVYRLENGWKPEGFTAPSGSIGIAVCNGSLSTLTSAGWLYILDASWTRLTVDAPHAAVDTSGDSSAFSALTSEPFLYSLVGTSWVPTTAVPTGTVSVTYLGPDAYALTTTGRLLVLDGGWRELSIPALAGGIDIAGFQGTIYACAIQ